MTPSDDNGGEFTEFQLEEIALGRAQALRQRLEQEDDAAARKRLEHVRAEIGRYQEMFRAAGDEPDAELPDEEMLARYLDGSLNDAATAKVEHALAGSSAARRAMIELYREVTACAANEPLQTHSLVKGGVVPFTDATPEGSSKAVWQLRAGAAGAVVCWAIALFGGDALRTPFAFGAVAAAAMGVLSGYPPASAGRTSRRLALWASISLLVIGIVLAVADPVRLPAACSFVATGIIALFALTPGDAKGSKSQKKGRDQTVAPDETGESEPERRGFGGH